MQPKTLQQINSELEGVYAPQVDSIRQQQAAIPGQIQAEESGLAAKQESAFGDIVNGARRRGLGFSGIPVGEQYKYNATEYMPALARLHESGRQQTRSLEDAILGINERRSQQAQGNYQYETTLAEQRRQFDEQQRAQAAQAAAFDPTKFAGNPKSASMVRRPDGGFNYTAPNGQAISAAAYAAAKNIPFRQLLGEAAKAGDKGAAQALQFVGDDFGYDPRKANSQAQMDLYNSLVWGIKPQAKYLAPGSVGGAPMQSNSFKPPQTFGGAVNPLALRR